MELKAKCRLVGVGVGAALVRAVSRERSRAFLVNQLGAIPGIPAKVAQQLGQLLPETPNNGNAGISWEVAREIVERASPHLSGEIRSFSQEFLPASLGQVHKVLLKDGRILSVKVQYPDLAADLEEQLDLLMKAFQLKPGNISINQHAYRSFFGNKLLEELDYEQEARSQRRFAQLFFSSPQVRVPCVYPELSSRSVLAQEFVEALPLSHVAQWPNKSGVANGMALVLLTGIFGHGQLHGDLHPGNWGCDSGGRLALFDYGSILRLSPGEIGAFRSLYCLSLLPEPDPEECLAHFSSLGFDTMLLDPLKRELPSFTKLLFAPLMPGTGINAENWRFQERAEILLGEQRWVFRSAGAPWFFQLMRAVAGAAHCLRALGNHVQLSELMPVVLKAFSPPSNTLPQKARNLLIRISRGPEILVDLALPARSAEDLALLIPPEAVLAKPTLAAELAAVQQSLRETGLVARELISASVEGKEYRVWLA